MSVAEREKVLCVDAGLADRMFDYPWTPWRLQDNGLLREYLNTGTWLDRDLAETYDPDAPTMKQLIPYVVILARREPDLTPCVLSYVRKAGDARLVGRTSIGVGGHIHPSDMAGDVPTLSTFATAAMREIEEELGPGTVTIDDSRWMGWLNDPSDDVGKVHLGVVVAFQTPFFGVPTDLTGNAEGSWQWRTIGDLSRSGGEGLESWSRILVPVLSGVDRHAVS